MSRKPIRIHVDSPGGGYRIERGRVVEWWGDNPPWCMFVGDYSQLEIRLLAHCSGDDVLITAVREGQDIHALTAQAVFDEIPKDISLDEVKKRYPELRNKAKPVNFGVIYGMGPQALAATLGVTESEAEDIINNRYMNRYPGVKRFIEKQHKMAREKGYVTTAVGRKRHLPTAQLDPKVRGNFGLIKKAERQAQNAPIQGLAADVTEKAMRDIRRFMRNTQLDVTNPIMVMPGKKGELPKPGRGIQPLDSWRGSPAGALWGHHMRMLLQVHDELVQECHPAVANYVMDESVRLMENVLKLKVPLKVDAALGTNWYDTKE